jgi:hypothetical protein
VCAGHFVSDRDQVQLTALGGWCGELPPDRRAVCWRIGEPSSWVVTLIQMQGDAVTSNRSKTVPKAAQAVYEAVVALTDAFCRDHLNDEYRDLAQAMTAALCRKRPNPLASGQPRTWSCGVIYALGQLNFLADKANQPYMAMADVCAGFGVGQSTAYAKARVITDALHTGRMDTAWMLRSLVDRNPLVWMAEVNGLMVDLRDMPREVQEIAFAKGMIPYIPADQK